MKCESLFGSDKTSANNLVPAKSLARLIVFIAMLTFGALAAQAVAPKMTLPSSVTVLENLSNTVTIAVSDADTNVAISSVTLAVTSSDTNLAPASGLVITGSAPSQTLTITPGQNDFGTATITVVATDSQPASTTNTFALHVTEVDQPPSYDLSTNIVVVNEESGAATETSFLTNMSAGPASQSSQTWRFVATTASGDPTNAVFSVLPKVSTNGTLTFTPKAHSYGTNLVTLVMINSGTTAHGGVNSYTNSFLIGVAQINHAPVVLKVANQTMLENATNINVSVTMWDYDQNTTNYATNNFSLVATNSNTNLVTLTVSPDIGTTKATNAVFSVTLALGTNQYGSVTNQLIATEGGLSTTNSFVLTVTHVNQAPSFDFDTNVVISNMLTSIEETLSVTNLNFLTNLLAGPTNAGESSQTWKFTVTTAKGDATNAVFSKAPAIDTNGNLTYSPKAHSSRNKPGDGRHEGQRRDHPRRS